MGESLNVELIGDGGDKRTDKVNGRGRFTIKRNGAPAALADLSIYRYLRHNFVR